MRVWGVVNVLKKIEIRSYSPEYRQGTLDLMRSSFFPRELFCKAAQIAGNKAAEDDLLGLVDDCLSKSKVSMIARDSDTGNIVGASVCLIQVRLWTFSNKLLIDQSSHFRQNPRSQICRAISKISETTDAKLKTPKL